MQTTLKLQIMIYYESKHFFPQVLDIFTSSNILKNKIKLCDIITKQSDTMWYPVLAKILNPLTYTVISNTCMTNFCHKLKYDFWSLVKNSD